MVQADTDGSGARHSHGAGPGEESCAPLQRARLGAVCLPASASTFRWHRLACRRPFTARTASRSPRGEGQAHHRECFSRDGNLVRGRRSESDTLRNPREGSRIRTLEAPRDAESSRGVPDSCSGRFSRGGILRSQIGSLETPRRAESS